MIPLEKLKAVKTIIVHANCPDGIASAMILHHALPDAEVRFVKYGPEQAAVKPEPGMLWCDITPVAERAQEFIEAGTIVLDHHESALSTVIQFADARLGVYSAVQSGAELAYDDVWLKLYQNGCLIGRECGRVPISKLAELARIHDLWKTKNERWTEAGYQATALMLWSTDKLLNAAPEEWEELLAVDQPAYEQRQRLIKAALDGAFEFSTKAGTRVIVFQGYSLSSDAAEMVGDEADLVVGYSQRAHETGNSLSIVAYSCRSHTGYNCAKLAQHYDGGGHQAAAGFQHQLLAVADLYDEENELLMELNPVGELYRLIEVFEHEAT